MTVYSIGCILSET